MSQTYSQTPASGAMTPEQQQAAFEQARARIEANVYEIRQIAQRSVNPGEFFPRFLELSVASLTARGAALWLCREGAFDQVAEIDYASLATDTNPAQATAVQTLLSRCAQAKQPCIVAAADPATQAAAAMTPGSGGEIKNLTPFPLFFIPVLQGDRVAMVLQLWMREAGDPKTYRDIVAFLADLASQVSVFLKNHQGAVVAHTNQELQAFVRMQSAMLGQLNIRELCNILANYSSDLMKADLVLVFRRRTGGKWRLESASNQEVVDNRSHHVVALTALANALPLDEKAVEFPATDGSQPDLQSLFDSAGIKTAVARPAGHTRKGHADFLVIAARNEGNAFGPGGTALLDRVCEASGKCLDAASHHHYLPAKPLVALVSHARRDWQSGRRGRVLIWASIPLILFAIFFLVPVPLRMTADCEVRPRVRSVAIAEVPGRVTETLVREGQTVTKGEVLARLDDRDYTTQLAVLEQQRLRWNVEAARAQALGNEPERKLAQLSAQREAETIRRIEYLRSKTEIRSPADGIVITKNLHNREGEYLETGAPFCEVAGTGDFEVVLDIKQSDIGQLLTALDEKGTLPVRFVLHPHAAARVEASIESGLNISQTPEIKEHSSFFLAVIQFPADSPLRETLKPGYTGKAKVRIGTTNFAYSLLRPFINLVRTHFGF